MRQNRSCCSYFAISRTGHMTFGMHDLLSWLHVGHGSIWWTKA